MSVLRELIVQFGVAFDTSGITKGESAIDGLMGKVRGIGAALAGAFALDKIRDFGLAIVEQADAIGDQAERLNVSVRSLEQWRYAAGFVEIAGEQLDAIFQRLAVSAVNGADASSEQASALKKLGVSVKDASGQFKTSDQLFEEVGVGLAGLSDATERTALAVQFFGKANAAKVLALFGRGADGIAKLKQEFEELTGGGLRDFVKQAGEVDDQMKRLDVAWGASKVRLAGFFVPALLRTVEVLTRASVWLRETFERTNALKTAATALGVVGVVKLSAMLGPLGAIAKAFGLIGLKIALPLLLLEDFYTFLEGGDSVIGRALDKLFGEGASGKVRKFFGDAKKAGAEFFDDLSNRPGKVRQDFLLFFEQLEKDYGGFWGYVARGFGILFDLATGGWANAVDKISAMGEGLGLALELVWTNVKFYALDAAAGAEDAWTNTINRIILAASNALVSIGAKFAKVPGMGELSKDLMLEAANMIGSADPADARAGVARDRTFAYAHMNVRAQDIAARYPGQSSTATTIAPIVNVHVAPGTPAAQVRAVGEAAARGVTKGAQGVAARAPNRSAAESFKQRGKG